MKCDELKSVYIDRTGDWARSGNDTGKFYLKKEVDAVIADLQKTNAMLTENAVKMNRELESLKASHYAESVDAGMENRRLKRALWLMRAERASDKARIFYFAATCGVELNIDGFSNKEKGHARMRPARWWRITWLKVERKCRAKAEEYK